MRPDARGGHRRGENQNSSLAFLAVSGGRKRKEEGGWIPRIPSSPFWTRQRARDVTGQGWCIVDHACIISLNYASPNYQRVFLFFLFLSFFAGWFAGTPDGDEGFVGKSDGVVPKHCGQLLSQVGRVRCWPLANIGPLFKPNVLPRFYTVKTMGGTCQKSRRPQYLPLTCHSVRRSNNSSLSSATLLSRLLLYSLVCFLLFRTGH